MEKLKSINKFILICFWIFIIGSVFGFFIEMLYGLVYTRTFAIRKGLIYGPFIEVYGMGALLYYFLVKTDQNPKRVFFKGMLLGGALEYFCSFIEEIFFGAVSWDYSNKLLNLNGRTCLQYCIYWGIIGIVFLKAVYPVLGKLDKFLNKKRINIVSYLLMIFVVYDIAISCIAVNRQCERKKGIPARNNYEAYLDRTYPDERLDKIFNNKREVE